MVVSGAVRPGSGGQDEREGPRREFPERLLAIEAAKQVAFADTEDVIVAVFDARREVVFCVDRGEIPAQV